MIKKFFRFEKAVAIGIIILGSALVAVWSVAGIAVLRHPEFQLSDKEWYALIFGILLVFSGSVLIFAQNEVQRAKELRRVVEEELENLKKLRR